MNSIASFPSISISVLTQSQIIEGMVESGRYLDCEGIHMEAGNVRKSSTAAMGCASARWSTLDRYCGEEIRGVEKDRSTRLAFKCVYPARRPYFKILD